MENKSDIKTFLVQDENGNEILATEITRMYINDTNIKYLIYSIDDQNDTRDVPDSEKQVLILAAKIKTNENGEEILENLSNEEERKAVYDAFQKSYKEAIGKKQIGGKTMENCVNYDDFTKEEIKAMIELGNEVKENESKLIELNEKIKAINEQINQVKSNIEGLTFIPSPCNLLISSTIELAVSSIDFNSLLSLTSTFSSTGSRFFFFSIESIK